MLLKAEEGISQGETYLRLTKIGGDTSNVKRPFDPYFYLPYDPDRGIVEECTKIMLSTLKEKLIYKVAFSNSRLLRMSKAAEGMEDRLNYEQRVAIDRGFNIESALPTHASFDLERGKGGIITAASYASKFRRECLTIDDEPEYEIIAWLIEMMSKVENPDLIDTYWGSFADWDWLIRRADVHGIPVSVGRDGSRPTIKVRTFKTGKRVGEDRTVHIDGRVHFDVWKEVVQDQGLYGIKNHKLKTVARWFGIPVIEVSPMKIAKLSAGELRAYCQSDADATYALAEIYLRNLIPLTTELGIAFNMTVERMPSHIAMYLYMRQFLRDNIVADKTNGERFPVFAENGYQGALVNLFVPGLHENIRQFDFKSMYPSSMICFNYDPETLLFVDVKSGDLGDEWVEFEGNKIRVYDKYQGVITVENDLSFDGISRREFKAFMRRRQAIKDEIKRRKDAKLDFSDLNSIDWAMKTIMNSSTGYHGMNFAACGCYPIIAQVTGIGRWEISAGTDFLKTKGALPVERDTDGIYYVGNEDYSGEFQAIIQEMIPDIYERDAIRISSDEYDAGIFCDEKNYVLRKGDKFAFRGAGLRGKHLPIVCDKALERIVWAIFEKENATGVLNEIGRRIRDFPPEDFVMSISINRNPKFYSMKTFYKQLVNKAENLGLQIHWGDEVQYLKTSDFGFLPFAAFKNNKIDYSYYLDRIASVAARPLGVTSNLRRKTILYALRGQQFL